MGLVKSLACNFTYLQVLAWDRLEDSEASADEPFQFPPRLNAVGSVFTPYCW